MKVGGGGEESAERFLSAQADPFTGVKGKKKSACSVRNDEQGGRAVMSGLKLLGIRTCVTPCIRTSVTLCLQDWLEGGRLDPPPPAATPGTACIGADDRPPAPT